MNSFSTPLRRALLACSVLWLGSSLHASQDGQVHEQGRGAPPPFTLDLRTFHGLEHWKTILADKDVVALGECTHGLGDLFGCKAELVRFLHEECGFELLLFESGFADALVTAERWKEGPARRYLEEFTSYSYYRCQQLLPLFEYVQAVAASERPLRIGGIDPQVQQRTYLGALRAALAERDPDLADLVVEGLQGFGPLYYHSQQRDTESFARTREEFAATVADTRSLLEASLAESSTDTERARWKRLLLGLENFETYSRVEIQDMVWPGSANFRDRAMFELVQRFRTEWAPGKKIILWAQNTHLEKRPLQEGGVTWLGHRMHRVLGERYYCVASVVRSGSDYSPQTREVVDFAVSGEGHLESLAHAVGQPSFLVDLAGLAAARPDHPLLAPALGRAIGGNYTFDLDHQFDAFLYLAHSRAPIALPASSQTGR